MFISTLGCIGAAARRPLYTGTFWPPNHDRTPSSTYDCTYIRTHDRSGYTDTYTSTYTLKHSHTYIHDPNPIHLCEALARKMQPPTSQALTPTRPNHW